jgi:hypothetical protein
VEIEEACGSIAGDWPIDTSINQRFEKGIPLNCAIPNSVVSEQNLRPFFSRTAGAERELA